MKKRLCSKCLKVKPVFRFYRSRKWICKECSREYTLEQYRKRNAGHIDFICRVCGRSQTADQASSQAVDICKSCFTEKLAARKAAAPKLLRCTSCNEWKPKTQFERYSLTRCMACAAKKVRKCQLKKEQDKC